MSGGDVKRRRYLRDSHRRRQSSIRRIIWSLGTVWELSMKLRISSFEKKEHRVSRTRMEEVCGGALAKACMEG